MITIFNRKKIKSTFSIEKKTEIKQILSDNNIKYYVKTNHINRQSAFGTKCSTMGTFGQNMELAYGKKNELIYEHIIYVHKNDFDKALSITNEI